MAGGGDSVDNPALVRRSHSGLLVLLAAALAVAYGVPDGWLFCPLRAWTSIPCVFCGGIRTLRALVSLNWVGAIQMNPLVFGLVVGAGVDALLSGWVPRYKRVRLRVLCRPVAWGFAMTLNWGYLVVQRR